MSPDFFELPDDIVNQVLSSQQEQLFEDFKNNLQENQSSTNFLITYFTKNDFFELIQNVCSNLPPELSDNIKKFYSLITNMISRRHDGLLDKKLYNSACRNTSVLIAPSDGDCFFKAVSDGINIYNYENQTKKIFFNNYGNSQLFTISVLRDIVYRYVMLLGRDAIDNMLIIASASIDELNDKFKQSINAIKNINAGIVTADQYLTELNNIYKISENNFLVYKPSVVPVDANEYDNPFRVLRVNEIERYIKSKDYWANSIAIDAMCNKLNICVVPIKKYDTTLGISNASMLQSFFGDKDLITSYCSQKVMFLLHRENHYELIKFNYLIKPLTTSRIGKWYTIFEDSNLIPPLNILLLIFGSAYINLDAATRPQFSIYQSILKNMETSLVKIFDECFNKNRQKLETFNNIFNNYFPNIRPISENLGINDILSNCNNLVNINAPIIGGDLNRNTSYYPSRSNYPRQQGYPQQYGYPQQGYPQQYGYPQQGYPQQYGYSPYYFNKDTQESQLAYTINIDMELYPGKSLSEEQLKNSDCDSKYNTVKKAFSKFTGTKYKIPSPYSKTSKNINQKTTLNDRTKSSPQMFQRVNKTRKNIY